MKRLSIGMLLAATFIAGILFATAGGNWLDQGDHLTATSFAAGAGDTAVPGVVTSSIANFEDAFETVAERTNPTVVQIFSDKLTEMQSVNPFQGSPFEQFFRQNRGQQPERKFHAEGMGSGVVVRKDGYIVTNNHVVDGADELKVKLSDGSEFKAKVIGTDPFSDLAVIKVDKDDLPVISFGDSDQLRVGQWVMAFGSPLSKDLQNSVTAGIVSAIGRYSSQGNGVQKYIQTDAAINPGNSGGPLVNLHGELVGINAAIYTRTGGYQGIGFSIPVNTVKQVADQLINKGSVRRARLGVMYSAATEALVDALHLPQGAAQVSQVVAGGAADKAGIREGDVITAINGTQLENSLELSTLIGNLKPGDTIDVTINRNGEEQTLKVDLGTASDKETAARKDEPAANEGSKLKNELGFGYSDITPSLARQLGVENDTDGVVVTDVDPNSDAFRKANVRRGLIITEMNRQPVNDVRSMLRIYHDIKPGTTFLLRLRQPDQKQTFLTALTKPKS